MEVDKIVLPGLLNGTRVYSPITLSREWSTLGRLVGVVFASCFGATLNGYFVSSFFIDHDLRKIDNVYHCCAGLADMMITAGILPIAAVVLLSGVWDIFSVCQVLQTLAAASTYSYSIFFALVAIETYLRVCRSKKITNNRVNVRIACISVTVFIFSITLAAVGTYLRLDYDYCQRRHLGDYYFRTTTSILIHGTCFVLTTVALIASSIRIRHHNRVQVIYRRSLQYHRDVAMIRLNMSAYLMYVAFWMPYLVVVNQYPHAQDGVFYHCAWMGVSRTLITSVFYGSLSSAFGRAYSNIFYYCCCKSSLYNYYPPRARRTIEYSNFIRPVITSEVKTHIMQAAVNPNSPQRASTSNRETLEL